MPRWLCADVGGLWGEIKGHARVESTLGIVARVEERLAGRLKCTMKRSEELESAFCEDFCLGLLGDGGMYLYALDHGGCKREREKVCVCTALRRNLWQSASFLVAFLGCDLHAESHAQRRQRNHPRSSVGKFIPEARKNIYFTRNRPVVDVSEAISGSFSAKSIPAVSSRVSSSKSQGL